MAEVKTGTVTQEAFERAFADLMGLPNEIAAMRRRLRELEERQKRAQEIVNRGAASD